MLSVTEMAGIPLIVLSRVLQHLLKGYLCSKSITPYRTGGCAGHASSITYARI